MVAIVLRVVLLFDGSGALLVWLLVTINKRVMVSIFIHYEALASSV